MGNTLTLSSTELVQNAFNNFKTGNIPALLDLLTDDVKWFVPGPVNVLPWVGARTGKKAVGEFFQLVGENIDFQTFEPREFVADNDKVVALGYWEGKSRKTGRVAKGEWAMVFTVKNGKITEHKEFSDSYEAYEAFK
jgi:ketosteroid isomerase-like protein